MITKEEIQELLHSTETYRVERTTSTGDMDKFQEAICAFANDLPNSRKNGYLILGAYDNGELSGLTVTDDLLKKIAGIRSTGNILPIPVMSVDRFTFPEGDLLVTARTVGAMARSSSRMKSSMMSPACQISSHPSKKEYASGCR